ncbi:hypothetical protein NP233_g10463 [Leucocoprinus birnbaumii]|uniref:Uncharacterized protein n=1 Tax=Leucocoprinus birnbaumii TaxID=56174 RepID=A0AAD5VIQ5_9AGAR|nr:hypothetical protein NP233_g10463 [Leucocoprinus birnbaumii]
MELETGYYRIKSLTQKIIGRALHESSDSSPKPILSKTDDKNAVWLVEKLENGRYRLSTKGAPTGVDPHNLNAVVALLDDQEDAVEWDLIRFLSPPNVLKYHIKHPLENRMWTAKYTEATQVILRPFDRHPETLLIFEPVKA